MKYIYMLIALSMLLFVGCASTMKDADKGLEKVHRKVDSVYESIRVFTDPLPLPFKLPPADTSVYKAYRHEEEYNPTLGPKQRICVIRGLPEGSSVEINYLEDGRPQRYHADEKDGKARLIVNKDTFLSIRITDGWTGLTHVFNEVWSCDFKWKSTKAELQSKCSEEE